MDIKKGDDVKIYTISQVSELTEEQFAIFVEDLKGWHRLCKKMEFAEKCLLI